MWRAEYILCVENFKFKYKVRIFNSDANTQIFFSFLGTGFKLVCPSFLIFPLYILIDSHQIIPSPCPLWSWKVVDLHQRIPLPVCSPDICLITLRVSVFKDFPDSTLPCTFVSYFINCYLYQNYSWLSIPQALRWFLRVCRGAFLTQSFFPNTRSAVASSWNAFTPLITLQFACHWISMV